MINSVDNTPMDFVLRTPLRAYGGAIVMALLPIVADAVVLAVYVLRHGWMNVPWQVITIFGALSFIGIGICIGLRCYKIRLTADRVEYRENPFPKSMRIEDVGAVYKAYRNNRPVILIASRRGPEADIVIDMMPFAGGELDKFLEMLLARMPEGSSVRRKSSRPRKRDSRVLFQAWLMLPISLLVFLILVFIGTTKLLQDGIAGTLQLVIAAGGFLVSYNMFSLDEERVVARLGIDPDTFRGKFLRFLVFWVATMLVAGLPGRFVPVSVRREVSCAAQLGWVLGIFVARPLRSAVAVIGNQLANKGKRRRK